jgi:vesicle transport protein SEC22
LLKKVGQSVATRCSVEVPRSGHVFHYLIDDGVCFMVLCDSSYPKRLGFAFLDDIKALFWEECKREFGVGGVDYRSRIECIQKPYHFIKFGTIHRTILFMFFVLVVDLQICFRALGVSLMCIIPDSFKTERPIQTKQAEYRNPQSAGSRQKLEQLNDSLSEVQNIMRQNIDELLVKGEALDSVGNN